MRLLANTLRPCSKLFQSNEITGQYIMALCKLFQSNEITGRYITALYKAASFFIYLLQ